MNRRRKAAPFVFSNAVRLALVDLYRLAHTIPMVPGCVQPDICLVVSPEGNGAVLAVYGERSRVLLHFRTDGTTVDVHAGDGIENLHLVEPGDPSLNAKGGVS